MGDTKETREKKGRGKAQQRREHEIEQELESEGQLTDRAVEHDEELELDLGSDDE